MTADEHDDAVASVRRGSVRRLVVPILVTGAVLITVALVGVQLLRPAGSVPGGSTRSSSSATVAATISAPGGSTTSSASAIVAASMPDLRAKAQQIADNMIPSRPGATVGGAAYVETTLVGWAGRNTGWIDNYKWRGAARTDIVLMVELDGYFPGAGPALRGPGWDAVAMETDYEATKDFYMDSGMLGQPVVWASPNWSFGTIREFTMIRDHGTLHTLTVGPRPSPSDSGFAPG
jgi:hypothetical protein